ncbi:caffeoyl-CoA O-methyltransferase 5 [Selaginella moellendorffii]|nr:caffeoyl-CoA O-methyltransferase 5 [Selaginella moellendorffii]XP_024535419.1 caffeoyl-CoA O-methyltransferase 5 [Selaginella moellendorffii]XP_024535420.1 caffeoyl-CoA O-methyltransferase 5 [Selaginella moellendorffii]|eukprot:XP_002974834.2 caffeoyl-CoA O-methyltransferase 5 [Selaginella moellendorffii]
MVSVEFSDGVATPMIPNGQAKSKPSTHATANGNVGAVLENGHANGSSSNGKAKDEASKHQTLGHKSLLKSDALYQYLLETSVYPREPASLRGLRELTAKHPWNIMTTSPDEGQFLSLLVKIMNAKNTIEIGVFTGYSLLSTALALPEDGKIIAMDIDRSNYDLGFPFLQEAGVDHKIDFREGPALATLDELVQNDKNHGFFDFIFIDADKNNYLNYHERVMQLVKIGGIIGYDNTLWNGAVVASDDEPMRKYVRFYKDFVKELNKVLAADPRIEISHISISDGITLCRRIV